MNKWGSCAILLASTCAHAQAQSGYSPIAKAESIPPGEAPPANEEIIVTAQKRNQRINDVPLAITAIGGKDLERQGIRETADLANLVPSFTVQTSAFDVPVYFIRGIGFADTVANASPTVTVYVDEVPLPYSAMARGALLDVDRVEVLKGPQGTLFGENATGGAVNYIAAKPTTTLHYGASLSYGRFNNVNADGYISAPLTDTLGIRVAAQRLQQDDWQYSTTRNDTRGQKDFLNGRAIVTWKPASAVAFNLSVQAWRDRSDTQSPQFFRATPQSPNGNPVALAALAAAVPAPDNDRATDWDPGSRKARNNRFVQVALRSTLDLSPTTSLTSITAYSDFRLLQPIAADGLAFRLQFFTEHTTVKHFSQELRLAGSIPRVQWLIGGNYEHDRNTDVNQNDLTSTNNSLFGIEFDSATLYNNNPHINTASAFSSVEYKLTDALTGRGSARYTSSRDSHLGCVADGGDGELGAGLGILSTILSGSPTTISPGQCATLSSSTFKPVGLVAASLNQQNFSWRTGLDWKLAKHTMLYANVAKGYKAGSFSSVPAIFDLQLTPVTQESVLAYETGMKTNLLGNRAHLDLSTFYYDYKNKQLEGYVVVPIFGALSTLVSIPKSRVYGAEAQFMLEPTAFTRIQLSGSYINTRVLADPAAPISPIGTHTSFIGESFPNSPRYQANLDVEQRFPITARIDFYLGGNIGHRSEASAAFGRNAGQLERVLYKLPRYTLIDLRAGLRFNGGTDTIDVWGKNVTNRFYYNSVTTTDATVRFTGMPVTYGIRFSHRM